MPTQTKKNDVNEDFKFINGMQYKWEILLTTQIIACHTYMFVNYTINFLNDIKINLQGIELL